MDDSTSVKLLKLEKLGRRTFPEKKELQFSEYSPPLFLLTYLPGSLKSTKSFSEKGRAVQFLRTSSNTKLQHLRDVDVVNVNVSACCCDECERNIVYCESSIHSAKAGITRY